MARLKPLPRSEVTNPIVLSMYDRKFGVGGDLKPTVTGAPGDWEAVWAAAPEALEHIIRGIAYWRNPERKLDALLRELSLARTGWLTESKFVFSQHCKILRAYGGSDEQVDAIGLWEVSDAFSPIERRVLAFTDCLCLTSGDVPDALFDALRDDLGQEALIELTYICSTFATLAPLTRALKLEYDEREEPVAEMPTPASFRPESVREPLVLPPRR